jgi:hypothetical protein
MSKKRSRRRFTDEFKAETMKLVKQSDRTLKLVGQESGEVIASPNIDKTSDAMAAGWSVGATDQNLLSYIVDIANEYLTANR